MMTCKFNKDVHCKPSYHAQTLVNDLPTMALADTELNEVEVQLGHFCLFHKVMKRNFVLPKAVIKTGIDLISADGAVHQGYPILVCYPADCPEQALVTCTCYTVMCPKCNMAFENFEDGKLETPQEQDNSFHKIQLAREECSKARMNE